MRINIQPLTEKTIVFRELMKMAYEAFRMKCFARYLINSGKDFTYQRLKSFIIFILWRKRDYNFREMLSILCWTVGLPCEQFNTWRLLKGQNNISSVCYSTASSWKWENWLSFEVLRYAWFKSVFSLNLMIILITTMTWILKHVNFNRCF